MVDSIDHSRSPRRGDRPHEMDKSEMRAELSKNKNSSARDEYRTRVVDKAKTVAFPKRANRMIHGKI